MNSRRHFVRSSAGVAAGVVAGAGSQARGEAVADDQAAPPYLLVHGAWHTSLCWGNLSARLASAGRRVFAIDLPGAGLHAKFPKSYLTQDKLALETEVSPLKGTGLKENTDAVVAQIRAMAGRGKVILVGHSYGGCTITRAAEQVPELIQRVVYLTAFVPVQRPALLDYAALPEGAKGKTLATKIGDSNISGAVRINNRNPDPAYIENCRIAFYNDVPMDRFLPFAASLVPDVPLQGFLDDGRGTAARWGTVPRSYIRCTLDQAIPIELQDRMVVEADAFTPNNRFDQHTLASSHSPFASMPDALAALLLSLS